MKNEKYLFDKGYRVDKNGVLTNPKGKIISGSISSPGYLHISTKNDSGKTIKVTIHRIQAYEKFGEVIFLPKVVVRHKNNNKLDNSYDNILIGTQSQNMRDIPEEIRISIAVYASSFMKKHNHDTILKMRSEGMSYGKITEQTGLTKGTISFIVNKSMAAKNISSLISLNTPFQEVGHKDRFGDPSCTK